MNDNSISVISYGGKSPQIHPSVFLCDGVRIIGDVQIGEDSSIWFNTVIRGDIHYIKIGRRVNVQDMCMLHVTSGRFPLTLEDEVSIGHGVNLHGCTLKRGCLVGIGAIVLDGSVVGEGSLIAAGALVREGQIVPPGVLFAGLPGKVLRDLTPAEIERVGKTPEHYFSYAAEYKKGS